jgi:hypothetical protein
MILFDDKSSLKLNIVNYETEVDIHDEHYDDIDWLMCKVDVTNFNGHWEFYSPFLTANDLPYWAEWFEKFKTKYDGDYLDDTDHVLAFKFNGITDELFHLTASFFLEGLPPWAKEEDDYEVNFYVPKQQLIDVVKSLHEDIVSFPKRFF